MTINVYFDGEKFYEIRSFDATGYSQIDVPYDGWYNITVNGITLANCTASTLIKVDRTSEFRESKPFLALFIVAFLAGGSVFVIAISGVLKPYYKLAIRGLSFIFVFSSFVMALLVAREYIKFSSFYNQLNSVYFASMIAINLLIWIVVLLFIVESINYYQKGLLSKYGQAQE